MKTKSKSKVKTKSTRVKIKKYPAHYFAIILVSALVIEAGFFNFTTAANWQNAVSVLDISAQVAQTSSDMSVVFQPITDTIANVNQFYALSTTAMTQLLDLSDSAPTYEFSFIYNGVAEFYNQASQQMASVLDMSSQMQSISGTVAGISISK